MEQNLPIIPKKFWNMVRVMYFMLRKGLSKGKLLTDLTMLMKRGKIAGKAAIHNIMFHHHSHGRGRNVSSTVPLNEYNTTRFTDDVLMAAAIHMINSASASPALPGFGRTPMVRQLRVTDSPFPLSNVDVDNHVDEDAEKFIMRFYNDLKRQNDMSGHLGYS